MKNKLSIRIGAFIIIVITGVLVFNFYFSKKAIYKRTVHEIEKINASNGNAPNLESLVGFYKSVPYLNVWQKPFICEYEIVMENKGCGLKPYTYFKYNNIEGTDGYIFLNDRNKLGIGADGSCNESSYSSSSFIFDPANNRILSRNFILYKTSETLEVRDSKLVNSRNYLATIIQNQSNGAISLESFDKVDGKEMNSNRYQLYFTATIIMNEEIWKPGNSIEGWFQNFAVLKSEPVGWDSFLAGDPKHYNKGQRVKIKGEATLERRERGWTVIQFSV